jgi:hypothetical protein
MVYRRKMRNLFETLFSNGPMYSMLAIHCP